jgi:hypothetical protein
MDVLEVHAKKLRASSRGSAYFTLLQCQTGLNLTLFDSL